MFRGVRLFSNKLLHRFLDLFFLPFLAREICECKKRNKFNLQYILFRDYIITHGHFSY